MTQPDPRPRSVVSRRTVVTAAAWSVPVLAAAIATPLAAASGPAFTTLINPFCSPGNTSVFSRGFTVTITGTLPVGSVISVSSADAITNFDIEVNPNPYTNQQIGSNQVDYTLAASQTDTVLTFYINVTALTPDTMTTLTLTTPDDTVNTIFGLDSGGLGTCL